MFTISWVWFDTPIIVVRNKWHVQSIPNNCIGITTVLLSTSFGHFISVLLMLLSYLETSNYCLKNLRFGEDKHLYQIFIEIPHVFDMVNSYCLENSQICTGPFAANDGLWFSKRFNPSLLLLRNKRRFRTF